MDKLPIISQIIGPLTDLLKLLTGALHSYGLAIIVFTILVKAVLSPLNLRQLHSAKKMSALGPRIKGLQQKYKGDREGLTKAQMALYKEEGVNPAAGCLPLVVQMPVLYALFFVFQELAKTPRHGLTTAIYHQTFLWFTLDKPDHLFGSFIFPHSAWGPLPIMAAALQWVQQRMMMQPVSDPQQRSTQQIMQFMPLIILVFATNYPAGLALYWVTSTAFAIVLQYFVTGWGQLFKSPLKIPEAPPVHHSPSNADSSRDRDDNKKTVVKAMPTARTTTTPVVENGRVMSEDENGARLGKMQRAAMRPVPKGTSRARASKGAKR